MKMIQRDMEYGDFGGIEDYINNYDKIKKTEIRKKKFNSLFEDDEKTEVIKKKSIIERIFGR